MPFPSWLTKKKEEGTFVEHKLTVRAERKRTVLILLGVVALLGWAYILFFSEVFAAQTIEVEGADRLDRGEVVVAAQDALDQERIWPFRARNMFFLDTDAIQDDLTEILFADQVIVDKQYPNILRLKIEERQSSLILLAEDRFYEIDRSGVITREISNESEIESIRSRVQEPSIASKEMPILQIKDNTDIIVNDDYITDFRMRAWLDAFHDLEKLGFGYRSALLDYATSSKLILDLFEPYDVYVDILEPLEPQINSYYAFTKTHNQGEIYNYVDARIPGKVFFK